MVRRLQAEHRSVLAESERATAHADALARKADGMQAVQAAAQQAVEACHAQAARAHAALEEQRRGWAAQLAAKQEDAQLVARQAEAACASRDTAQQHLASLMKAKAAAAAAAQPRGDAAAGVKEAAAAEVDPLKVLRPFTASRDAQGIADALRAAQAQHARGMSLVTELEAQISEQRETAARLRSELEMVAHVSTLSVAGLSPAVAQDVARDATSAEADALRAEEEAAAAEAQAAWLAEGLASWRDRLRAAAGTAAAAAGDAERHGSTMAGILTVEGAQSLVQAVEHAAAAAVAARQARSEAPEQAPPAGRRHRRRSVDSDGFELDSDDSRVEAEGDDCGSECDDGGTAAELPPPLALLNLQAASALDGGQQDAVAVDIGRLWRVVGQPSSGGDAPDTARTAVPDTARTELVTRQALKQRGAAAAAQLRRLEAGETEEKHGGKQPRGRDHLARHRAARYAASHRDGDGAASATSALLSGKTPSADCLLHELLALRRDVDNTTAAMRGPATVAQKGHIMAVSRSASPVVALAPSPQLGSFGAAAAAARAGVKVVPVMRSEATAVTGTASVRGRATTPDPMRRAPPTRTAAAAAPPLGSSTLRRPPSVPRSTPGSRSTTPVATSAARRGSGSTSSASPSPAARSSTPSRSRSSSPMSSREASFGSATLRLRTK